MGSAATLPLSEICDVVVQVAPQLPATPTFNQGLIVGPSAIIPAYTGANPRIRVYTSLAAILADGFLTTSPEYIAASLYFSQVPAPQYLWIGRLDLTAMQTVAIGAGNGGTGYAVGDILVPTQGGSSNGSVVVTSIGANGAVTGVAVQQGGTAFAVAAGLPTTTNGAGVGALVDITAIGETPLAALIACRNASSAWWACMVTNAQLNDHVACAAWAQTAQPQACYFYSTSDASAASGAAGNVFDQIQNAGYDRAWGIYSTTQGGSYPNNAYAAAAAMGVAMGLNTGLENSYFTLKFKQLVGVAPEPLNQTTVNLIENNNGNLYLSYANVYEILEQGVVGNGQFLDEVLNLDMLASDIQYSVVNLLVSNPSVPQTDAGQTQILAAVNGACDRAVHRGFLSPGVWNGVTILALSPNTPLPLGYLSQSPSYKTQSRSDRAARKGMPVYVSVIEAGSMHSVTIGVEVQR